MLDKMIYFFIPSERAAVQVCMELNDQSAGREISNLLKASTGMREVERLIIVTAEGERSRHPEHPEIELIPIDHFLLTGL